MIMIKDISCETFKNLIIEFLNEQNILKPFEENLINHQELSLDKYILDFYTKNFSMDDFILELYRSGKITRDNALIYAQDQGSMKKQM